MATAQNRTPYADSVEALFRKGNPIQYRTHGDRFWKDIAFPSWSWATSDYRVRPPEQAPQLPETEDEADLIPWAAINRKFTHSAREPNGMIFAYQGRPEIVSGGFSKFLPYLRIDHIMNTRSGSATWAKSIQERREIIYFRSDEFKPDEPISTEKPAIPQSEGVTEVGKILFEISSIKEKMRELQRQIDAPRHPPRRINL